MHLKFVFVLAIINSQFLIFQTMSPVLILRFPFLLFWLSKFKGKYVIKIILPRLTSFSKNKPKQTQIYDAKCLKRDTFHKRKEKLFIFLPFTLLIDHFIV